MASVKAQRPAGAGLCKAIIDVETILVVELHRTQNV